MSDWRLRGACVKGGADPELFFSSAAGDRDRAKTWCSACVVKTLCLRLALESERAAPDEGLERNLSLRAGVFGGMTGPERFALEHPERYREICEREAARNQRLRDLQRPDSERRVAKRERDRRYMQAKRERLRAEAAA